MRTFLAAVLLVFTARAYAACPEAAPYSLAVYPSSGLCSPYQACPNGTITWQIGPAFIGPNPSIGGYQIQPCDTIVWSFGDGTTQSLVGSDRVTHDYPAPGNYFVKATVTNALGGTTATANAVIATSPSRVSFVTSNSSNPPCGNCVVAREGDGPVTIVVERSLDLSRTISADAVLAIGGATIRVPLQFAPGETRKSFTVPIADDSVYSGTRYIALSFENGQGGVLNVLPGLPQGDLVIADNDPPPTLSIDPAFTIAEGDAGQTPILIPLHLSAPMGVEMFATASITLVAATVNDVSVDGSVTIPAGETEGFVKAAARGNIFPEPDKTVLVTLHRANTNADPVLGTTTSCFVTVVNDDAAIYPEVTSVPPGIPGPLTLNIGSPFREATTVTFTSSAPDVIPVPAPVTIPAGETKVWVTIEPRAGGVAVIGAVVPGRHTQPSTVEVSGARRHAAGR